jgi:hypothetical protein
MEKWVCAESKSETEHQADEWVRIKRNESKITMKQL